MDVKFAFIAPDGLVGYVTNPSDPEAYTHGEYYDGFLCVRIEGLSDIHQFATENYWDFNSASFCQLPPSPGEFYAWDSQTEQWVLDTVSKNAWLTQTINPIRDHLEGGRVVVDGHLIDIDERAEKRMSDALELWDALGVTTLPWTLGDNTILHVDKAQLQRFYDEGRRLRALRSLQLHTEARALKDNLDTTQEDIDAWAASYA